MQILFVRPNYRAQFGHALPVDYERAYFPVRMAHALGLPRVSHERGRRR